MDTAIPKPGQKLLVKVLFCALVSALALGMFTFTSLAAPATNNTFNVYFVDDGYVTPVEVTSGYSLLDALDRAGIALGEYYRRGDKVRRPVTPNQVFRIEFRGTDSTPVRSEIPYETLRVPTSLFPEGTVMRVNYGRPGLREGRYGTLLVGGVVAGRVLREETIVQEPVHSRVLIGSPGTRISPFDFEWERGEDGNPINYHARLTNQRATAYSDIVGYITSTGQRVAVGLVAVNPRIIPYGSLLYIASECRTFVYGYAIAADTGGDLLRGRIDIDLFYDSHLETIHHGNRRVNIFILRLPQ